MLIDISIETDKDTYNPLLEPNVTGHVSVWGHYSDRTSEKIGGSDLVLGAKTKLASGDVEVIRLDGERIVPAEGGIGTIVAIVVADGRTFKAEKDIVVRPFYHEYHQTLVLKIFSIHPKHHLGTPTCTFEETLTIVRKTDHLTRGIPKILYLQGYQEGGFDQLFPAWLPVDPRLKREEDETALESLRWLIREARQYNTIVSLHIDMIQAYTNSPMWDEYVERDVVGRDEKGEIILRDQSNNPNARMNWTNGLQGYSWWGRGSEHSMRVPERLSARGAQSRSETDWDVQPGDFRFASSMHGEKVWLRDREQMTGFLKRFCTMALPYFYLSQYERRALVNDILYYTGGVVAGEFDGRKIIRQGDYVLVENGDVFVKAIWCSQEIIAYSTDGYVDKRWTMPSGWEDTPTVDLYRITLEGVEAVEKGKAIENGQLTLSLAADEAISIIPSQSILH